MDAVVAARSLQALAGLATPMTLRVAATLSLVKLHDEQELEALLATARPQLADSQQEPDLGLAAAASGPPLQIVASRTGLLWDALRVLAETGVAAPSYATVKRWAPPSRSAVPPVSSWRDAEGGDG